MSKDKEKKDEEVKVVKKVKKVDKERKLNAEEFCQECGKSVTVQFGFRVWVKSQDDIEPRMLLKEWKELIEKFLKKPIKI